MYSKVLERKTRPDAKLFIRPDASGRLIICTRTIADVRTHAHTHERTRTGTDADEMHGRPWSRRTDENADARTHMQQPETSRKRRRT